ncbi:TIGR03619 family F420-dependent LLM class oxidoreductase [Streptomyces sp. B1866]|uniref:TIGR03619 family F420-dependent LLM class oxidoreductase n=1 Tax=Streptomyces sp. B1866 TaxID=3075431 RepID=UPI00288DB690|nr:TIGR03619 family F420-dependent LLM class oxidoreductase [Streptomyces sp. B1866]MDT3399101.1 TIGR03619 family F420-dependent LLM class oxidoreductase [Streptomyces sp. B1866]
MPLTWPREEPAVQVHVVLPDESPSMGVQELVRLAREAEELGYEGVWLPDHVLPPGPYGPDRYGGVYESLVTLAYLAAATERVTLGTTVVVLPLRAPLVLARQAATLAHLSGGRFVLGAGVGWEGYEFDAAGVDFGSRGALTTSSLRLIRHLHEKGGGPYRDRFHAFDERAVFQPVPERPVPFLIGGNSQAALRRAAELGDWWQGFALGPEEFSERRAALRELSGGRPVAAGARISWDDDGPGGRTADDLRTEADAWQRAGADHLSVWFGSVAEDGFGRRMRALAARLPGRARG